MLETLTTVWTPTAIGFALFGGFILGFGLVRFPSLVGSSTPSPYSPARTGIIAILLVFWIGTVFYVGQIAEAVSTSDAATPRVISRYTVWLMFSLSLGTGVWLARRMP